MADPIASFQGLGTGIQFRSLVDSIIAAESAPITLVQSQISAAQARSSAWGAFRTRVQTLNTQAARFTDLSALRSFNTSVGDSLAASVTAGTGAQEGSFALGVQQLATNERMGSDVFASRTDALGLSGEFIVNGRAVTITADQSLEGVARSINSVNSGSSATRVSATVVGSAEEGYRMVLTSQDSGSVGMQLFDGATGLLQTLGFLDASVQLRNRTSDGATSDGFSSSSATLNGLLGLTAAPSGTVDIGGLSVAIDLAQDSLDEIAAAINDAATTAGSAITAAVVQDAGTGGTASYRLDISGTTAFTDSNAVLESLGVLQRGRSAVAQEIQFAAFTANNASSIASGTTRLTQLWSDGVDANVSAGDTIDIEGVRGDGSTFTQSFSVQANSTYQDLVDALNSATDGFQAGSRTATASIDADGRIVVTDDTGGSSQLALRIFTNNEGGGSLDFGEQEISVSGRLRELVSGQDAIFQVDGQTFVRSRNTVSDVVDGVSLSLTGVTTEDTDVQITRDVETAADALQEFVDAMNDMLAFTDGETYTNDSEREVDNPLRNDAVLRGMRAQLKSVFETTLAGSGDINRMGDLGVTIQREGNYEFDRAVFTEALQSDPGAVERLFQVTGTGSISSLQYVFSGDDTQVGSYDIDITQAASQAVAATTGFGGTYADDGTADTLQITDGQSGSVYSVSLNDGDTASEIVDALNAQFGTAASRRLQSSSAFFSDAAGSAAGTSTRLQDLFDGGGASLGIADGDVITISGTTDAGASILTEFAVTDVATQSLGDLADAISAAAGSDVEVTLEGGFLTATSTTTGARSFTLSVTSDNAGGGSFAVGGLAAVTEGRDASVLTAAEEAGEVVIRSSGFGSAVSFDLAFTAGGADGTASLGLTAGSYTGVDVQGTIGGEAATGTGRSLTAEEGTAAAGLVISYAGADTGVVGDFTFTRGIAALVEQISDQFLELGGGIDGVTDRIDDQIEGFNDRIDNVQDRLERRRVALIRQFTRLEESIAEIQARGNFLLSQLASLPQGGGGGLLG